MVAGAAVAMAAMAAMVAMAAAAMAEVALAEAALAEAALAEAFDIRRKRRRLKLENCGNWHGDVAISCRSKKKLYF